MKDTKATTTAQATHAHGGKKTTVDPDCCTVPPGDPGPST